MKEEIENIFLLCNNLINHCDIDYNILINSKLDNSFFYDYNNTRVVNSFLFNFSKLQDKIGGRLFKKTLYTLKEIDTFELTMIDVLNHLERLNIITSQEEWDKLREIRNTLAHEYPMCEEERIENIQIALEGYTTLKKIYNNLLEIYNEIK